MWRIMASGHHRRVYMEEGRKEGKMGLWESTGAMATSMSCGYEIDRYHLRVNAAPEAALRDSCQSLWIPQAGLHSNALLFLTTAATRQLLPHPPV
ncbi:hypothetical protein FQA47_001620 [Oryzias melastigma]|uniref:Uncharacterized protein n=1 Tax=Oryzias melastigma TaxID=30732 RepID=A0A834BW97_ORYME|nr:hypothetical protein FQA47_001620 [Oryzias melastigma]